ncbi:MAG: hypothetical protein Q9190_000348 [Brigantiaea leucoxantha]
MASSSQALSSADPSLKQGGINYLITQSTFVAIATLLVLTRVYVRSIVVKKFGFDDAVIVLAWSLAIVVCGLTSRTVYYSFLFLSGKYSTKAEALYEATTALKWSSIAAPIDASQGEDWYMRIDGNGLLVRTLPLLRGKNNELGISTGICAMVRTILFTNGTAGAEKGGSIQSAVWAILEINVGIIAASIPTLKPLFNPSRPSIFQYFRFRLISGRYRKNPEKTLSGDSDGEVGLKRLTLNTMPSAIPSSISYYQHKHRPSEKEGKHVESQDSMSQMFDGERTSDEMEAGSKLEIAADGQVHNIGESMV